MMHKSEILAKVTGIAGRVLEGEGVELVDTILERQRSGWFLRIYIDRPGGITLDDCQRASEQLSVELDVQDPIPGAYTLEVSSPGLDRPLRTDEDYQRFSGRLVAISTFEPVNGQRHFTGRLHSLQNGIVTVIDSRGSEVVLPRKIISKARLEVEIRKMGGPLSSGQGV